MLSSEVEETLDCGLTFLVWYKNDHERLLSSVLTCFAVSYAVQGCSYFESVNEILNCDVDEILKCDHSNESY